MSAKWFLAAALTIAMIGGCANKQRVGDEGSKTSADQQSEAPESGEVKIKLDQTPPAVRQTIERELAAGGAAAGGEIEDIAKIQRGGKPAYEVDVFRKEGGKLELIVGEDGKVLSRKNED